jgi:hypothetical protein
MSASFLPSSFSIRNHHLSTLPILYPSMSASALLKSRVARPSYLKKLAKAEDLIHHFPHDSWIVSQSKLYHLFHPMALASLDYSHST